MSRRDGYTHSKRVRVGTALARGAALVVVTFSLVAGLGCKQIGALSYYLGPERKQKAEFTFPKSAVIALVFDPARPEYDAPVFQRALQARLEGEFRTNKSTATFVPIEDWFALRRDNKDYSTWSVRRIGQELKAEYVLYVRIDECRTRLSRDVPVVEPYVALRAKVILTRDSSEKPRVWPEEERGRELKVSRPAEDAGDPNVEDTASSNLGMDTAVLLARYFFEYSLEDKADTAH